MAPARRPRCIPLTPKQAEALLDRADGAGGQSIAEALGIAYDEAFAEAERLVSDQLRAGRIDLAALDACGPLPRRILIDCLDGSTWCALHDDGGMSACPALRGARRTITAVHRKLSAAGLALQAPVLW
jgi:hypothetical protein